MPDASANGSIILPNGANASTGTADEMRELRNPRMYVEVGATGLRRYSDDWATISEEFLPQLASSDLRARAYKEMAWNDPIVGASLRVIDMLVRRTKWHVEPASSKEEDRKRAEYIDECLDDLNQTWSDTVSEILSMLTFGWSFHEIVYKRRQGDNRRESRKSLYDDGKVGWAKFAIRGQDTLQAWVYDEDTGDLLGMRQLAPPKFQTKPVPYAKSLLFRTTSHRENPEGVSILRTAYESYYRLKRMKDLEGIGHSRDLTGLPVMKVPSSMLSDAATPEELSLRNVLRRMVQNVRMDTQAGVMIPNDVDPVTKQPIYEFSLISSPGGRITDMPSTIQRYEQRIAMSLLTDFMLLGQDSAGSFALSSDKTSLFLSALDTYTGIICEVVNQRAIPKLMRVNGWDPRDAPQLEAVQVRRPNLAEIGGFLQQVTAAGAAVFPNDELMKWLFSAAQFPELTDEMIEEQEREKIKAMEQQQQAMVAAAEAKAAAGQKAGPGGPDGTANAKPAGGIPGQQQLGIDGKAQPPKRDNQAPPDARPKRPARTPADA